MTSTMWFYYKAISKVTLHNLIVSIALYKAPTKMLYEIVVYFFSFVLGGFFREIKPRGSHKIPKDGPIIFVAAPHANQFVDPLILMKNCQRKVSFLIAEKSMKRKYVGAMARALNAIPVTRPQDLAKLGEGKIYLKDRVKEPTRINGINTRFTKQLTVKGQISLPDDRGSSEIIEIISDTELRIKKEFKDLKALELLTQPDGTFYKCLPRIDQSQVYEAVFKTLNAGNCIGIFPEGGSHDRTEILPLKAGVTVMALGAMANNSNLDVKIVPCGLNYFHAHQFRSRAVVEFGSPIQIPSELVKKYQKDGTEKREACSELLKIIYDGLKSVTVNTPDYDTLMVIQAARRLYKPEHSKLELTEVTELNRRFVDGYIKFKDDPRVQEMNQKVISYNQSLKNFGLKDHQVQKTTLGRTRALVFALLSSPLIFIARKISAKKAADALKTSTVKVAGRDVLATWKLLVTLGIAPILYGSYVIIFSIIVYKYNWRILNFGIFYPLVILLILMVDSYATLKLFDTGLDIYRSLPPLFLSLLPSHKTSMQSLLEIRDQLSLDLTELINDLGPKMYPDFESARIVKETKEKINSRSASPSPSPSRPLSASSLRLRSLSDWFEDKTFDWEKTEDSDYDDVFFFIDQKSGGRITGRSRRSSGNIRYSGEGISNNSTTRSRSSSFNSNVSSSDELKVEGFTKVSMANIPRIEINDVEDSGYQGDKETAEIESKKDV
ncbi:3838_t:CDS:10 [Diversispora eburnea]|uniref:3838_t:CDS:1 n=1 Tax=Diversispora eburnea TaxID=1213867 RepID=A0A9N8V360_9GLOM|nr:3838_t:CDS:10 [Diversispora eburnea]